MWIIVVAIIVFFIYIYEKSTEIKKPHEDQEVERERERERARARLRSVANAAARASALVSTNSLAESEAIKREAAESITLSIARGGAADLANATALAMAKSFSESTIIENEAAKTVARDIAKTDALATTKQLTTEQKNYSNLHNDPADSAVKEKINAIISAFERQGVYSIWHMTHRNNIKNILQNGILSNTQAFNLAKPVDISDPGVQSRRDAKDPIYGRKIHDYTPTYFNIKNPMLSVKRAMQDELCLIEISLSALLGVDFIFTDGNAAARDTKFYSSLEDLKNLPWNVLNSNYWTDFEDGKRKRCSEILIYPSISPKHIKKIHCSSDSTLQQVASVGYSATKTRELFF